MTKKRKFLLKLAAIAFVLCIYPLCVLAYTSTCVLQSDLDGGGNGPLDAYRHTLASAVVSYTIGEWGVKVTNYFMESKTSTACAMDRQNNLIGAKIGSHAKSFKDIEPTVHKHVLEGACFSTKADQTTWLPKERWSTRILW